MPAPSSPNNTDPGGDIGSTSSTRSSGAGSILQRGSPSQRAILQLMEAHFWPLLNAHGFPQASADHFYLQRLEVESEIAWPVTGPILSSPSEGLLTVQASGLQLGAQIVGLATLASGQATVLTPSVGATSLVFLTIQSPVNPGFVYVANRVAGTSFTIQSSSATDASTIAWLILESA